MSTGQKKKDEFLVKIKLFTDSLFKQTSDLSNYEDDTDFVNFKFRIINMLSNHLKILNYINKYMNNFYCLSQPNIFWFNSIRYIMLSYGLLNKNQLYFNKFKPSNRKNFKNVIVENYINLNDRDLNELYRLYNLKIIDLKFLEHGKHTLKKKEVIPEKQIKSNLNEKIHEVLKTKLSCQKCPHFKSDKLFVYSNVEDINNLHVMFINDFNTQDDFERNKIYFKGNEFDKLKKFNFLIINTVPCDIQGSLVEYKKVNKTCKLLMDGIINKIKAKIIVSIGQRVAEWFGFGKLSINGRYFNNFNGNKFLLVSKDDDFNLFNEGFKKIISLLHERVNNLVLYENKIDINTGNFTLFDVKVFGEKILYIVLDENNNKHYYVEDVKYPIFIKEGKYSECDYIESEFTKSEILNNAEKMALTKRLFQTMTESTRIK